MEETTAAIARKHPDMWAYRELKLDYAKHPFRALLRHRKNFDLVARSISRKVFTRHGIQGVTYVGAGMQRIGMFTCDFATVLRAALSRLAGLKLGKGCRLHGRLRTRGNYRNLKIGEGVIFEGDAEFILPRGVGQGRIVIGDSCVIAQGALFHCMAGDLVLGPSSYVGRNVVLQSNGDLRIGAWTLIAANAGLYASNHVTSGKDQPIWTQGNSFTGITIGQNCWIGHGGVVVDGVELGDNSIVGPNIVARGVHGHNSRLLSKAD
jgi:acetyltransferase-like isoleucine patch superfamily enzyme